MRVSKEKGDLIPVWSNEFKNEIRRFGKIWSIIVVKYCKALAGTKLNTNEKNKPNININLNSVKGYEIKEWWREDKIYWAFELFR